MNPGILPARTPNPRVGPPALRFAWLPTPIVPPDIAVVVAVVFGGLPLTADAILFPDYSAAMLFPEYLSALEIANYLAAMGLSDYTGAGASPEYTGAILLPF